MSSLLQNEVSGCRCAVYKHAERSKLLSVRGNPNADFLFLMSYEYPRKLFKMFISVINTHKYSFENAAFLNSVGCIPKDYRLSNSPSIFIKCKEQNLISRIKKIKPKVIFTDGLALRTIVEDTNLQYKDFYNKTLLPTFFYTSEFNSWVLPLPPLLDYIIKIITKNPNVEEGEEVRIRTLDNYANSFFNYQLEKGHEIINKKITHPKCEINIVKDNIKFLNEWLNKDIPVAVDIETTGLRHFKDKIISIQFSFDGETGYFLEWSDDPEFIELLNQFFKGKYLIAANGKFDMKFLIQSGIKNLKYHYDVNYAGHFVYSRKGNSLKANSYYFTDLGGYDGELERYKRKYNINNYGLIPKEILGRYSAVDSIVTYRLKKVFDDLMTENQRKLFKEVYMPLANLFVEMEILGMPVDIVYLNKYKDICFNKARELEKKIKDGLPQKVKDTLKKEYEIKDINIRSEEQIGALFKVLGAKSYGITTKGFYSTQEQILKRWGVDGIPFTDDLIKFRHVDKLLGSYLSSTSKKAIMSGYDLKDGRVHASFNFQNNWVGRLACSSPNLQNMPIKGTEDFRPIFKAPEGYYFGEVDYSGFHLRLVAMTSGDKVMTDMFRSKMKDMHSKTGSSVFTKYTVQEFIDIKNDKNHPENKAIKDYRDLSKVINFSLIYGGSHKLLSRDHLMSPEGWSLRKVVSFLKENNITDVFKYTGERESKKIEVLNNCRYDACAKVIKDKFFREYHGVQKWIDDCHIKGSRKGYVDTFYGFRIWLPEFTHPTNEGMETTDNKLRNVSVNGAIIGTEANIMQKSMLEIDKYFKSNKLDAHIVNQVHDSLLFIFKEGLQDVIGPVIKDSMIKPQPEYKGITLDVEGNYGKVWGGHGKNESDEDYYPWYDWESATS
jgi:DNA polymerase-1